MIHKPEINQFFDYSRMQDSLHLWAKEKPDLCKLEIIGKSHQERDIFALSITNFKVGNPDLKPAYYIDACIHAEEVMGTNIVMYIAWHLMENYGKDPLVTKLLDEQVFYLLPRANPDGAEFVIKQGQPWCGNGRYLPGEEQPKDGFIWRDLDQNGVVAQMRIKDADGEWKISSEDPRFMVLRNPWEFDGEYYRLLPEGVFNNYEGEWLFPKPRDGNLNRQFPALFHPEGRQYGAGNVPLEEPESRAMADFILAHPNIGGLMAYHTNAGAILRPFGDKTDEHFIGNDLKLYEALGKIGTEITRYPLISVYQGFTPNKDSVRGGCLDDWTFEFMGIPSFVTELWNVNQAAGVRQEGFYPSDVRTVEEEVKVLNYLEQYLERPYLDWQAFDHPQLGEVEIGGWDRIWVSRNAPPQLLEKMAVEHCEFCLKLAATLPRLAIKKITTEKVGDHLTRITATITNRGYMGTYLTDQALYMKADDEPRVRLAVDKEFELVEGRVEVVLGHLEGRAKRKAPWSQWGPIWQPSFKTVQWMIRHDDAVEVAVTAFSQKAGAVTQKITIE